MNIKILDSWLREHLKTKATPKVIAEKLSLTSVSVEKIEEHGKDFIYDIEVTSNRPDLMSIIGIAREAATILPQFNIEAEFIPLKLKPLPKVKGIIPLTIKNDPKIVNRVCAVLIEVQVKESPMFIKERLETIGIRSLNNLIDVTNYVMREVGHPTHVFDFDRLNTNEMIIRESKKNEKIITLDKKEHILQGGDIVADDGKGKIIDLLGVMGTENSVVTDKTKRILFFLDNNDPHHIRKTSMSLGIRSEAAILNEKGVDPELAMEALIRGIELYEKVAEGKLITKILDIYPNKIKTNSITVTKEKIDQVIGVEVPLKKSVQILENLGFEAKANGEKIEVKVPTWRTNDITIQEDIIEEIARVYGYYHLPSILPPLFEREDYHQEKDQFYWEQRVKNALKYWGFTEVYTYSMVSENLLQGPTEEAVGLANPLNEELVYLRKTLTPSLLEVLNENKTFEKIKIFEISNVYEKVKNDLPKEKRILAGVVKKPSVSFFEVKGIIESLLFDLGIKKLDFKESELGLGALIYIGKDFIGEIEMLSDEIVDFELDFEEILKHATLRKIYKPISKYPPVIEDLAVIANSNIKTGHIIEEIKKQSSLITEVSLFDQYENTRTFHIVYQDQEKNLTTNEVSEIRNKIIASLEQKFEAKIKN